MNNINTSLTGFPRILGALVLIVALLSFVVPMNVTHLDTILIAVLALACIVV